MICSADADFCIAYRAAIIEIGRNGQAEDIIIINQHQLGMNIEC
jgi:hypothetical protein